MNLVLMGTPAFVVPIFDALRAAHNIMAVFTRAPSPQGRKKILTPSPVHAWADAHNIPVFTNTRDYNFTPDAVVVVSYGVMLRDNVLSSAPCINIHPSALPQYRGPSPLRSALYNGDAASEICLMQITPEMDAGDVYMRRAFDIDENDTNDILESRVAEIGADMLREYFENPGAFPAAAQVGEPTFTRKWTGADEIIDWSRGARAIHNQVRALGAGRTKINGADVKILSTRINASGELDILRIQPAGKKPMDWSSFVNGLRGADVVFGK